MQTFGIILGITIVIGLVLGEIKGALERARRGRQCACLEYQGDNPACPVPEHRRIHKSIEAAERRPTHFELELKRMYGRQDKRNS